jgi:hypothetical protein
MARQVSISTLHAQIGNKVVAPTGESVMWYPADGYLSAAKRELRTR